MLLQLASVGSGTRRGIAPISSIVPTLGVHALNYHTLGFTASSISTPSRDTQASGSVIVSGVAMGEKSTLDAASPTDNKSNTLAIVGSSLAYSLYPSSGAALYADVTAAGGSGHVVTRAKPTDYDEVTLWMAEVKNASFIDDVDAREILGGNALTQSVDTTGPAVLIAVAWGDAGTGSAKVFTPNNGFSVIESIGDDGSLIQCFVAAKEVSSAGTYSITWSETPDQGALMWLIAVR